MVDIVLYHEDAGSPPHTHHYVRVTTKPSNLRRWICRSTSQKNLSVEGYKGRIKHRRNFTWYGSDLFASGETQYLLVNTLLLREKPSFWLWHTSGFKDGWTITASVIRPCMFGLPPRVFAPLECPLPVGTWISEHMSIRSVFKTCREAAYNLFVMLYARSITMEFRILGKNVNPLWDDNQWNKANGSYTDEPMEFFLLVKRPNGYKQQLRYIISKWDELLCHRIWVFLGSCGMRSRLIGFLFREAMRDTVGMKRCRGL